MRKFLSFLGLCWVVFAHAQIELYGKVKEEKDFLYRANVILLDDHQDIVTYAFTKKDGSFFFAYLKQGKYQLKITYQGYHTRLIPITLKAKDSKNLGIITLSLVPPKEIKEVVIKRKSIAYKKDTISFRAMAFSNGTEQSVEDLLKKLPGVKVSSDGKISVNNKEVSNVLVEGDDIFESGYQTLTQNMPAEALSEVQVVNNYTKNKLLKNIQDTDNIALNLTIKKKAKSKWFGSVLLASTSYLEDRRQGKFNLMNFSKRRKTYLLFNANNLGLNEMKGVQYLIEPSSSREAESVGDKMNTLSIVNLHSKNSFFEDKRTNFNNDQLASVNHIQHFKNEWKLKFVSIYNTIQNSNYTNSVSKNTIGDLSFTNVENKTWHQKNRNIVGKLELLKEFKNESNFVFYNKFSSIKENNNNRFLFNDEENKQIGENELFSGESKLVYTKKINENSAWVAVVRGLYQKRPYVFSEDTNVFSDLLGNPDIRWAKQNIDSRLNFVGGKWSYLRKKEEDDNLELQLGVDYKQDILKSDIQLFNELDQEIAWQDEEYTNDFSFTQKRAFTRFKYKQKLGKHWKYGVDVSGQFLNTLYQKENEQNWMLMPGFNLSYQNQKTGNFSITLRRNLEALNARDLLPNYLYNGGRNLSKGNVGFEVMPKYFAHFNYSLGNQINNSLMFNSMYSYDDEFLGNHQLIQPTYSVSRSILIKDKVSWMNNLQLSKYLNLIESRVNLIFGYNYNDYKNKVNDLSLTKTINQNYNAGITLKSGWLKKINYEAGFSIALNHIKSEYNNRKYADQKAYFNFYYTPSKVLNFTSKMEYYKWGSGNQKPSTFWDVEIDYQWKSQKANLFVHLNNLLNTNEIQSYSINNVTESIYIQKLLPRHIVFGISKNF